MVVAAYNNTEPRFNLTSLAPGRDYVLAMFASHARGRGHQTTLIMKTHTPKAEQVAPERVRPANCECVCVCVYLPTMLFSSCVTSIFSILSVTKCWITIILCHSIFHTKR